jgi:hypothetical protein
MKLRGAVLASAVLVACVGTTGGALVDFPAAAAGAEDATSPLLFDETGGGRVWHVTLTQATLHVGAVYLALAQPVSGAGDTSCVLPPPTYVAEVLTGLDVNLLSPAPQPFPAQGHGVTTPAIAAQVWLTGGDVNATSDSTKILVVAGSAHDDSGTTIPFQGTITISDNRIPSNVTTGANPPCKQRIVSPIPTTVTAAATGGLLVRIDAKTLFRNVDFSKLPPLGSIFAFSDDPTSPAYTQPSINLWGNLKSSTTYALSWQ